MVLTHLHIRSYSVSPNVPCPKHGGLMSTCLLRTCFMDMWGLKQKKMGLLNRFTAMVKQIGGRWLCGLPKRQTRKREPVLFGSPLLNLI